LLMLLLFGLPRPFCLHLCKFETEYDER